MWPFTGSSEVKSEDEVRRELGISDDDYKHAIVAAAPRSKTAAEIEAEQPSFAEYIASPSDRLGLRPEFRATFVLVSTFLTGFMLGAQQGSNTAANRYRAENAHRMPVSKNGWYLYRRSKGYHAFVGGVTQGVKYGGVLSLWTGGFLLIEDGLDRARGRIFANHEGEIATGQKDFVSTVSSAVAVAGIYSWTQGLDPWAAARTAKLALRFSIPLGLVQDGLFAVKGHPPVYLKWLMSKTRWVHEEQKSTI